MACRTNIDFHVYLIFTFCNLRKRQSLPHWGGEMHTAGFNNNNNISRLCSAWRSNDSEMPQRFSVAFHTAFIWRSAAATVVSHSALLVVRWSGWCVWEHVEGLMSWKTHESSEWASFFSLWLSAQRKCQITIQLCPPLPFPVAPLHVSVASARVCVSLSPSLFHT